MRSPLSLAIAFATAASGCEKPSLCERLNAGQDAAQATCLAADHVRSDEAFATDAETWPVAFELAPPPPLARGRAPRRHAAGGQRGGLSWTVADGDPNAESVVERHWRKTVRRDSVGHVVRVALSPHGSYVLGFHDGRALVRDASDAVRLETQAPIAPQTIAGYEYPNRFGAIGFSTDGALVALGDAIGTLEVWDVERGERVLTQGLGEHVQSLAFSDGGTLLSVGTRSGSLRVVDGATGESVATWALPNAVLATRVLPDGLVAARTRGASASDIRDQARGMGETSNLAPGVRGVTGPDLVSLWQIPGQQ